MHVQTAVRGVLYLLSVMLLAASCSKNPMPDRLIGDWNQDSSHFQSASLIGQFSEIDFFEGYEMQVSANRIIATRLVGKEPDRHRVYWESRYHVSRDDTGVHYLNYLNYNGSPIRAIVHFNKEHLMLKIGNREMAFLNERAVNIAWRNTNVRHGCLDYGLVE